MIIPVMGPGQFFNLLFVICPLSSVSFVNRLIARGVNAYLATKALPGQKPETISRKTIDTYLNSTTWGKSTIRMARQGSKKNTEAYRVFGK
jgi:hypothetical protein